MKLPSLLPLLFTAVMLTACKASKTTYDGPPINVIEGTRHVPLEELPLEPPTAAEITAQYGEVPTLQPVDATLAATADDHSTVQATSGNRVRSALFYQFQPGAVYQIDTQPGFLTSVVLEPGERIVSRAAGDTDRWRVDETLIGQGDDASVSLLIKPLSAPLVTNLIITTTRRMYQLELISHETDQAVYQPLLSWRYPGPGLTPGLPWKSSATVSAEADDSDAKNKASSNNVITTNIDSLDFDYSVQPVAGDGPVWKPQRVFHDGLKTYVQFPAHILQSEAPPLFVRVGKEDQLVNYRVVGDTYVVDRVLELGVLKVGKRKQDQVVLTYNGSFFGG